MERPTYIRPEHWQEWLDSGVDPSIIALNVRSVSDLEVDPYSHEVETPIADCLNWRYTRFGNQAKKELRGWMVQGTDPETGGKMDWLRFKPDPDTPVMDRAKGKPAKYLSPRGDDSKVTFLDVDRETWERVSQRCGVPIQDDDTDFWAWVKRNAKVPITAIEGEKKAGCLLSLGYAAIALPGAHMGVRTKDSQGRPCAPRLIPELEPFAQPGRQWNICFDHDTKPKTIQSVDKAIEHLAKALIWTGGKVKVTVLPGPEKGVDDFVMARGAEAFHKCYEEALTFEEWQAHRYSKLTAPADLRLNARYLPEDLPIPDDAKLVLLKSPKGTGKTQSFKPIVDRAAETGQPVLLITHRIQLAQALCERLGVPYFRDLNDYEEGGLFGYGICVDSLFKESAARFNAEHWHNTIVIIDEAEQVLWHLLSSTTEISNRRMPVIEQIRQLFLNTLESPDGKIILSDADLSDQSVQFVRDMTGWQNLKPWTVINDWTPDEPWDVHHYPHSTPEPCVAALDQHIEEGGKPFVYTQSQRAKGRWSTTTLEGWLRKRHPDKKILRVDSQTVGDPGHEAYGCTTKLNEILPNYDVVLVSPVIETGVSIDLKGHFTGVWAILNGVAPENSARQALARVREPIPRHVWVKKYGLGRQANGSTYAGKILSVEHQTAEIYQTILQTTLYYEDELAPSMGSMKLWANMAARINAGGIRYREAVLKGLEKEGHIIMEAGCSRSILDSIKETRDEQHQAECEAIAAAEQISPSKYEELKGKKSKTCDEQHQERKHKIEERYCLPATPELVSKDDDGWYAKLRLFYFLTIGRQFLAERDKQTLEAVIKAGGLWMPTLNRNQYITRIATLEGLGVKKLMNPDEEFSGGRKSEDYADAHPALLKLREVAINNSGIIRDYLGVTISSKMSPIQVAQVLLSKIGLKLTCDRQEGGRGARVRIYKFEESTDGRHEVLSRWFTRDEARQDDAVHTPGNKEYLPCERAVA